LVHSSILIPRSLVAVKEQVYLLLTSIMAPTTGVISDLETMGEKADMSHEEVVHLAQLTDEEKVLEKKLLRRIDSLIMPLVVLVYLLNYIDRYEQFSGLEYVMGC
jgi:hypothetical protein